MRRLIQVLVAILVTLLVSGLAVPGAHAGPVDDEADFVQRINHLRTSHGLQPLVVDSELTSVARRWAAQMAAAGEISHNPDLGSQVHQPWTLLGENVGRGPDVPTLHDAFVASPGHYENLVEARYTHIGVGVVFSDNGTMFTAHQFMTLTEASSAPAPAPRVHGAVSPAPSVDEPAAQPASAAAAAAPTTAPTLPGQVPVGASAGVSHIPSVLHGLRALDGMR